MYCLVLFDISWNIIGNPIPPDLFGRRSRHLNHSFKFPKIGFTTFRTRERVLSFRPLIWYTIYVDVGLMRMFCSQHIAVCPYDEFNLLDREILQIQ